MRPRRTILLPVTEQCSGADGLTAATGCAGAGPAGFAIAWLVREENSAEQHRRAQCDQGPSIGHFLLRRNYNPSEPLPSPGFSLSGKLRPTLLRIFTQGACRWRAGAKLLLLSLRSQGLP